MTRPTSPLHTDIVTIETLLPTGAGLCHVGERAVVVPTGVPGDQGRLTWREPAPGGHQGLATDFEVTVPSPYRTTQRCDLSGVCGGCQAAHITYEAEFQLKLQTLVVEPLKAANLWRPTWTIDAGQQTTGLTGFRNKAIYYPGRDDKGQVYLGFYQVRSHVVVRATHCPHHPSWMHAVTQAIEPYLMNAALAPYDEATTQGVLRAVQLREGRLQSGEPMRQVTFVVAQTSPALEKEIASWPIWQAHAITSVTLEWADDIKTQKNNRVFSHKADSERILVGSPTIQTQIDDLIFEFGPKTFLQVNSEQTWPLYQRVLEDLAPQADETILDLYCGVGTISLMVAKYAQAVIGVEMVVPSIEAANRNLKLNQAKYPTLNATFYVGVVEDVLKQQSNWPRLQKAVVDPSYRGLDESVPKALSDLGIDRIVYVACSPKNFVRDALRFQALGYELTKVSVVDLFVGAWHLEVVGVLERNARS